MLALAACEEAPVAEPEMDEAAGEYERGPHNGRLLVADDLAVELAIYETGEPPEFRAWVTSDGEPVPPSAVDLEVRLTRLGNVVDARRIPPEQLSLPLRASDVMVLPYRSSLNSGALLLALSFGRPVIAAASPHVIETVGSDAAITFEPHDRRGLEAALRGVDRLLTPAARDAALSTAKRFDPDALSRRFASALRERLGGVPAS